MWGLPFVFCLVPKQVMILERNWSLENCKLLDPKYFTGEVVPLATPRTSSGLYWGYTVRTAQSFGAVFTESPYKVNYNIKLKLDYGWLHEVCIF